jgi:nicotinate-nucleotide pyrophosphorylase (carboxylating)
MTLPPLSPLLIEPLVRSALLEDLGTAGDLTTDAIVDPALSASAALVSRVPGVIAGLGVATLAFRLVEPLIDVRPRHRDGDEIAAGEVIATLRGPARGLLTAERTALNFLCHMSGIATATAAIVAAVRAHRARIVCTRKTMPSLRAVEKYAVRAGGGSNHRFGLSDAVLIKDNHLAIAGSVPNAVELVRARVGHLVKIEVEVETLTQLEEALSVGVDAVLLDNMDSDGLRRAVQLVDGRAITEASGRITPASAPAIAETGVDLISIGWITHSVPALDIGLDVGT